MQGVRHDADVATGLARRLCDGRLGVLGRPGTQGEAGAQVRGALDWQGRDDYFRPEYDTGCARRRGSNDHQHLADGSGYWFQMGTASLLGPEGERPLWSGRENRAAGVAPYGAI